MTEPRPDELATDDVPNGVDPPRIEEQLDYLEQHGWPT